MTAAFILGINMSIAAMFAVAFAVVAATNRTARGARWIAAGYALGIFDVALEFGLAGQRDPTPLAIGIFLVLLAAMTLCVKGVACHYRVTFPRFGVLAIWLCSLLAIPVTFELPYLSLARALLYQLPYVAMQSMMGWVIWRSQRRQPLDLLFAGLNLLTAATYLLKPAIAHSVGSAASPQGYMGSTYAAVSQSIGSVTLIALAVVLLLIMMRDTTAEMVARSETDPLSGILNLRGFRVRGDRLFARAAKSGEQMSLVAADLDHFKAINDRFGHAVGDRVIAGFSALLRDLAGPDAVVARLGGEEFAVLLPSAPLALGRRFAERARAELAGKHLPSAGFHAPVTASFGVAQMASGDSLSALVRRADAALYKAKASGRDRVNIALTDQAHPHEPRSAGEPLRSAIVPSP
jgi:diguanylate cyclase (GGDEF)-like protein